MSLTSFCLLAATAREAGIGTLTLRFCTGGISSAVNGARDGEARAFERGVLISDSMLSARWAGPLAVAEAGEGRGVSMDVGIQGAPCGCVTMPTWDQG